MVKVSLDKTVSLTRKLMNNEITTPECIELINGFDRTGNICPTMFRFINSKTELPIEHLGLAVLSYANAVDQYTIKQVQEDGSTNVKFESLIGSDAHVSDFVDSLYPDALNWYVTPNGPLQLTYVGRRVPSLSYVSNPQCKVLNEQGEDIRELTVREAYSQAVSDYVVASLEGVDVREDNTEFATSLHDFMQEDATNFDVSLHELQTEANKLVINQTENLMANSSVSQLDATDALPLEQ